MIPIREMIDKTLPNRTTPNMTLDSKVVEQYVCPGCEETVTVRHMPMPIGPQAGERVNISHGCKCAEQAMVKQLLQKREEIRKQRIYDLFDQNSLLNDGLKKATFDNYEPSHEQLDQAKEVCLYFAKTFNKEHPRNLILSGSYGVGKSHLARAITHEVMKQDRTAIFISVPKLLTKLKATYNRKSEHTEDELLSMLEEADCLVLDDIGAEYGTDHSGSWATSKVFEIVDSRMGKHTVYTTNMNGQELQAKVGLRNFSRMMQHTEVVKMYGEDYRLKSFR